MQKNSVDAKKDSRTPKISEPLLTKAYAEALKQRHRWQTNVDEIIREILELGSAQPIHSSLVPSTEEIRREMSHHIPDNETLSDLIIAMREE